MFTALGALGSAAMPYISGALGTAGSWLGTAGTWIGKNLAGIGSILGGAGGALGSLFGSSSSAKKQFKYQKRLANHQYALQLQGLKEFPAAQRQGLVEAGYNPLLALNGHSAQFTGGSGSASLSTPDIAGSSKAMSELGRDILAQAKATVENIKADTALKQGQLSAVETQRLQTEANTSLLQSQTERSDLAYGRDIVDAITGIVGTGASLYSAKSLADLARAKAQRLLFNRGVPGVGSSANSNIKPNVGGNLGSNATTLSKVIKGFVLPVLGGYLGAEASVPLIESIQGRDLERTKRELKKHPIHYKERNGRSNFVPRFGM